MCVKAQTEYYTIQPITISRSIFLTENDFKVSHNIISLNEMSDYGLILFASSLSWSPCSPSPLSQNCHFTVCWNQDPNLMNALHLSL